MKNSEIYKRLYKDYTKKFLNKILLSVFLAAWPNVYLKMQNEKVDSYHLNGFGMSFAGLIFSIFYFFYERGQTIPLDFNNVGAVFFLTVPGLSLLGEYTFGCLTIYPLRK